MTATQTAPARQDPTCRAGRPTSLRAEHAANARLRRRRLALGLPSTELVDAQPAREHVQALRNSGMSIVTIAAAAGISSMAIDRLLYGLSDRQPSQRMRPENAAAILAVQPRLDLLAKPPGDGTRRRLRALMAVGWSMVQIGAAMGWDRANLWELIHRDGAVEADTHRKACQLYDQLWNVAPPQDTPTQRAAVTKARNTAARHGWAPPAAWDDDEIDDPNAKPYTGTTVGRAPIDLDEVDHLAAGGVHIDEIARRLDCTVDAIKQARWRARRAS